MRLKLKKKIFYRKMMIQLHFARLILKILNTCGCVFLANFPTSTNHHYQELINIYSNIFPNLPLSLFKLRFISLPAQMEFVRAEETNNEPHTRKAIKFHWMEGGSVFHDKKCDEINYRYRVKSSFSTIFHSQREDFFSFCFSSRHDDFSLLS